MKFPREEKLTQESVDHKNQGLTPIPEHDDENITSNHTLQSPKSELKLELNAEMPDDKSQSVEMNNSFLKP